MSHAQPQAYKRYAEVERPPSAYGRSVDFNYAKKYEAKPEKIRYEIKVYIPRPEPPQYSPEAQSSPVYEPFPESYQPNPFYENSVPSYHHPGPFYQANNLLPPKYEQKMPYMKPYYAPEENVVYESKPAYAISHYNFDTKTMQTEKGHVPPNAFDQKPVTFKRQIYMKPSAEYDLLYEPPAPSPAHPYELPKPSKHQELLYDSKPYKLPDYGYPDLKPETIGGKYNEAVYQQLYQSKGPKPPMMTLTSYPALQYPQSLDAPVYAGSNHISQEQAYFPPPKQNGYSEKPMYGAKPRLGSDGEPPFYDTRYPSSPPLQHAPVYYYYNLPRSYEVPAKFNEAGSPHPMYMSFTPSPSMGPSQPTYGRKG